MVYCIVCKGKADNRPELMFHKFPNDEELRQMWIKNMGIEREISKTSRLCSIHFAQKCFKPPVVRGNPRLKDEAIPTIMSLDEFIKLETIDEDISANSVSSAQTIKVENNDLNVSGGDNKGDIEMLQENQEFPDFESVEEFSPSETTIDAEEKKKMIEELQYSCRKISVRTATEDKFSKLPDAVKVMYFMEAKHLIKRQERKIYSLQRSNNTYKKKAENLTIFVKSMQKEIKKRNQNAKIEW